MFLCLQLNRNSHYQVPQASMKPVPPPKPMHLKVSRVASAQEAGRHSPQGNPRKLSDVDAHNRIPPPSIPPPVTCVQLMIKFNWFSTIGVKQGKIHCLGKGEKAVTM